MTVHGVCATLINAACDMDVINCYHAYACRPIALQYGVWDTIRVDQGKEWTLLLYLQELLADYRSDKSKAPHIQTTSKEVGAYIVCNHLYICYT